MVCRPARCPDAPLSASARRSALARTSAAHDGRRVPSRCGHGASVRKNCEPFVFGPLFAIDSTPAPVCRRSGWISSANVGLSAEPRSQPGHRQPRRSRCTGGCMRTRNAPVDGRPAAAGARRIAALDDKVLPRSAQNRTGAGREGKGASVTPAAAVAGHRCSRPRRGEPSRCGGSARCCSIRDAPVRSAATGRGAAVSAPRDDGNDGAARRRWTVRKAPARQSCGRFLVHAASTARA